MIDLATEEITARCDKEMHDYEVSAYQDATTAQEQWKALT